jgi:hypothetical protein
VGWARARYDRYGPVSWTRAFGVPIVNLLGPDAAEVVLVNRDKAFSQEGWRRSCTRSCFGGAGRSSPATSSPST